MTPTAWAETDEFYAMFSHEMEERAGAGMGIWNGSTWRTINTKGTDVEFDPYFDGLAHTRRRTRVDGSSAALDRVARTVSSVVFASDPVNDGTYGSGEWVAVRVKFDEDVLLTGSPQLSLDIGGVARDGGIRPRPIREPPLPQQALRGPR